MSTSGRTPSPVFTAALADLRAGQCSGAVARRYGLSSHQISRLKRRYGLQHRWTMRDSDTAGAERRIAAFGADALRARLGRLASWRDFDALAREIGVSGGELARHALRQGLPLHGAACLSTDEPLATVYHWARLLEALVAPPRAMRAVAGFRDPRGALRVYAICAECAAEGGCGHAPQPKEYADRARAGKTALCHRRAKKIRGDQLRRAGEDAKALIEAPGYWTVVGEYVGGAKPIALRCPEGHVDDYIYNKARRGQRCRDCHGPFAEAVVVETVRRMFGGDWIARDRSFLTHTVDGRKITLELDGLCQAPERHRDGPIAVAHDGGQHAGFDIGPGRGRQDLKRIARYDRLRARLLAERGVPFVRVRDLTPLLERQDAAGQARVFAAIEAAVRRAGLPVPDYKRFDLAGLQPGRYRELQRKAEALGLELRTPSYTGRRSRVEFFCPVHDCVDHSTGATFLQRTLCCRKGEGAAARRRFLESRAERIAIPAAAGVTLAGSPPPRIGANAQWRCREGHVFRRDIASMEGVITRGEEPCPLCLERARKGIADGRTLTARRHAAGLSVRALADRAGVPLGTLSNHERGRPIAPADRARYASALGCQPEALLDNPPSPPARHPLPPMTVLRRAQGLSQKRLATRAGISDGRLSTLERGKASASPALAATLAEILGVSVKDLGITVRPAPKP